MYKIVMCYPLEWFKADWHGERSPWAEKNYLGNEGGEKLGHWRPVRGQRYDSLWILIKFILHYLKVKQ